MTAREFAQLFRPFVRVLLDWDKVEHSDWRVETGVLTSIDDLAGWYFPWYVNRDGSAGAVDDIDSEPLAVLEWNARMEIGHRASVDALLAALQATGDPLLLLLPTYALPEGRKLLLDGNHRLAAVIQGNLPFAALVVNLCGPVDAAVLPDLTHWLSRD